MNINNDYSQPVNTEQLNYWILAPNEQMASGTGNLFIFFLIFPFH